MGKGRERSAKWYFDNEKEVMESLGLEPTPGSGSGWVNKEDGENEHILAQLKSTDKGSYSLKQLDLQKLEYNASVAQKVPLFIVQFLKSGDMYVLCNLQDIPEIAEYINTGEVADKGDDLVSSISEALETKQKKPKRRIGSSSNARERFHEEREKQFENRKRRF